MRRRLCTAERSSGGEIDRHLHVFLVIGADKFIADLRVPDLYPGVEADDEDFLFQPGVLEVNLGNLDPALFVDLRFISVAITPDCEFPVFHLIGIKKIPVTVDKLMPVVAGIQMEAVFEPLGDDETVVSFLRQNPPELGRDVQAVFAVEAVTETADEIYRVFLAVHRPETGISFFIIGLGIITHFNPQSPTAYYNYSRGLCQVLFQLFWDYFDIFFKIGVIGGGFGLDLGSFGVKIMAGRVYSYIMSTSLPCADDSIEIIVIRIDIDGGINVNRIRNNFHQGQTVGDEIRKIASVNLIFHI